MIGYGRILPVAVLTSLAALVMLTPIASRGVSGEEATFCLGFILIFSFFLAKILKAGGLPEISGYIIAGLLCGPFLLNILSREVVRDLQIFDDVALSIIALIAGGEMRLSFLRKSGGSVLSVITGQILMSFAAAFAVVFVAAQYTGFLGGVGTPGRVAAALFFGTVIAARSPSTTIGVVTEMKSKGHYTDLIVGITVILDVFVLILAALLVPVTRALMTPGETFSFAFARDLFVELFGSFAIGVVFGFILIGYMRWFGRRLPVFLVGLGFVGSVVSRQFHLEPLLAFMIAGFMIENFTVLGEKLIVGLERSALPVYVIFFAISGAAIDLGALRATWPIAVMLVVVRATAYLTGSMAAGAFVREARKHVGTLWMGLLSQAGVTIGLASIFERKFAWAGELKTITLAMVALNQLIGPVALKYILVRKGEAGQKSLRR
jgi:Kef-type K+ transport system membrane component KefB